MCAVKQALYLILRLPWRQAEAEADAERNEETDRDRETQKKEYMGEEGKRGHVATREI